jgi:type VI secretion system ImpB/VipA family protein
MIDDSIRRLPFCIGVIGDFRGMPLTLREPPGPNSFVRVTVANFDTVLREMEPRVACQVENTLTGVGHINVELTFRELDDFDARKVAGRFDPLRLLLESREDLSRLLARLRNNEALSAILDAVRDDPATVVTLQRDYGVATFRTERAPTDDLLSRYAKTAVDRIDVEVRVADALRVTAYRNVNDRRERAANLLRSFVTHVDSLASGHLEKSLEVTIQDLDRRISEQLDRIIHAADFMRLEASWRGLARLVRETERIGAHVRLLNLQKAMLHDYMALDAISRETDVWGGEPVTVIVNDFPMVAPFVNPSLRATGSLSRDGKAILINAASPELLGLGNFAHLDT